ncbi:uncharacterized protein N7484_003170 [Penicillium longicatenatum]|uniref:uncharacterized protein n=1 Tax=Penicillium longicatenatum TaxID=1561947 RepID=UPI002548834D|nr:uncharacterized protein N7484_003170 [Penicillium longicatenatum]KAJ5649447.1 hypothetical protein N7484_003170 [Penicillium longicatenatum]
MSADLLAEFGQDSGPPQSSVGNSPAKRPQTNSLISSPDHSGEDFFSSLSTRNQPGRPLEPTSASSANRYQTPTPRQPPGFELFNLPGTENSDVLFDAETDAPANDTEDDWGDFEGPESTINDYQPQNHITPEVKPPATKSQPVQIDLLDSLSLADSAPTPNKRIGASIKTSIPTSNPPEPTWDDDSFGDWDAFTDTSSANTAASHPKGKAPPRKSKPITKHNKSISTAPKQPTQEDDFEDWGDFTDGPAEPAEAPKQKPKSNSTPSTPSTPDPRSFISSTPASPPTVRPTNIPPPSVLLSLLVEILSALQKEALKAQPRSTPPAQKEEIAIKIYTTLTTSARIIAGRSLRWKRDTILSQSMRIGPAGKPGGMKLSAVNKHEDVKESQDAVDVLRLWRERSALFNAIVQGVGQKAVPVFTDPTALKVVVGRSEEGAIKASHPCALCALKRDERVLRVDEGDVNDSFGEWWTEHWGHTGCRMFWERNKDLLLQR